MPTCATARRRSGCTSCGGSCGERTQISEARPRRERQERPRTARLFVALDPSEAARAAIAAWRDELLAGRDDLRLPPAESLHVTLAFLGHRPPETVPELARVALGAVEGLSAPALHAQGVKAIPRRRLRLLALDLADPEGRAADVQAATVGALAAADLHAPEERPFWPHLTLARVRATGRGRGGSGHGRSRGAVVEPTSDASAPSGALVFDRVALFRSHLSASGARYEALERRCLADPT